MNMTTPPKRGEIWRANLEPTEGDEIRKTRPVVVISRERAGKLNLRVVVPVTDWNPSFANYPWMVRLDPDAVNGLSKTSAADTFQIRSIAFSRFRERAGTLPEETLDEIAAAVAFAVDYKPA